MLEQLIVAACAISALVYMGYLKNCIDEARHDRDVWKRRFIDTYTREISQSIQASLDEHIDQVTR